MNDKPKSKKKYTKPSIRLKINTTNFFVPQGRFFNSLDELIIPSAMASQACTGCSTTGGCGPE